MDAVAPLAYILEECSEGLTNIQSAIEAARSVLILLSNTSGQTTKERRKRVTKDLNTDLLPLAEDTDVFTDAALLLFGSSFETKMKEHLESLKCFRKSLGPRGGDHFFRRSRPHYLSAEAAATTEKEVGRDTIPTPREEEERRVTKPSKI